MSQNPFMSVEKKGVLSPSTNPFMGITLEDSDFEQSQEVSQDYDQIEAAIQAFHAENDKPTCIIMDTTKGKGVSFMSNSVDWHGKGPNDDEYKIAIEELNAAYAALEQEEN